jgi:hypothetical protein
VRCGAGAAFPAAIKAARGLASAAVASCSLQTTDCAGRPDAASHLASALVGGSAHLHTGFARTKSRREAHIESPSPNQSPISAPRTYESDWLWTQEPESTGESDRVWIQESESKGESDWLRTRHEGPGPSRTQESDQRTADWVRKNYSAGAGSAQSPDIR